MSVQSRLWVRYHIHDGTFQSFDSGHRIYPVNSMTGQFSADILVPSGAQDLPISLQGVVNGQQMFFWSDGAVTLKLIPYGGVLDATIGIVLMPGVPSVVAFQNIVQITVSNNTDQQARFLIQGAGV